MPHKVCNAIRRRQNRILDFRYAAISLGPERLPSRNPDSGAYGHVPTDVAVLSYIFKQLPIQRNDVLVEVGCGKGRVIAWWLSQNYENDIIGIEVDDELATFAENIFNGYGNVSIIHGDACLNLPQNGTVYYTFNPFDHKVMTEFKNNLWQIAWERFKRTNNMAGIANRIKFIYYYPVHLDVFTSYHNWRVEMIKQLWWERFRPQKMECALIQPVFDQV